jgi:hypothetical protein
MSLYKTTGTSAYFCNGEHDVPIAPTRIVSDDHACVMQCQELGAACQFVSIRVHFSTRRACFFLKTCTAVADQNTEAYKWKNSKIFYVSGKPQQPSEAQKTFRLRGKPHDLVGVKLKLWRVFRTHADDIHHSYRVLVDGKDIIDPIGSLDGGGGECTGHWEESRNMNIAFPGDTNEDLAQNPRACFAVVDITKSPVKHFGDSLAVRVEVESGETREPTSRWTWGFSDVEILTNPEKCLGDEKAPFSNAALVEVQAKNRMATASTSIAHDKPAKDMLRKSNWPQLITDNSPGSSGWFGRAYIASMYSSTTQCVDYAKHLTSGLKEGEMPSPSATMRVDTGAEYRTTAQVPFDTFIEERVRGSSRSNITRKPAISPRSAKEGGSPRGLQVDALDEHMIHLGVAIRALDDPNSLLNKQLVDAERNVGEVGEVGEDGEDGEHKGHTEQGGIWEEQNHDGATTHGADESQEVRRLQVKVEVLESELARERSRTEARFAEERHARERMQATLDSLILRSEASPDSAKSHTGRNARAAGSNLSLMEMHSTSRMKKSGIPGWSQLMKAIKDGTGKLIKKVINPMKKLLQKAIKLVAKGLNVLVKGLKKLINKVKKGLMKALKAIAKPIKKAIEALKKRLKEAFDAIKNEITKVVNKIKDEVMKPINDIINWVKDAFRQLADLFKKIAELPAIVFGWIKTAVSGFFSLIGHVLKPVLGAQNVEAAQSTARSNCRMLDGIVLVWDICYWAMTTFEAVTLRLAELLSVVIDYVFELARQFMQNRVDFGTRGAAETGCRGYLTFLPFAALFNLPLYATCLVFHRFSVAFSDILDVALSFVTGVTKRLTTVVGGVRMFESDTGLVFGSKSDALYRCEGFLYAISLFRIHPGSYMGCILWARLFDGAKNLSDRLFAVLRGLLGITFSDKHEADAACNFWQTGLMLQYGGAGTLVGFVVCTWTVRLFDLAGWILHQTINGIIDLTILGGRSMVPGVDRESYTEGDALVICHWSMWDQLMLVGVVLRKMCSVFVRVFNVVFALLFQLVRLTLMSTGLWPHSEEHGSMHSLGGGPDPICAGVLAELSTAPFVEYLPLMPIHLLCDIAMRLFRFAVVEIVRILNIVCDEYVDHFMEGEGYLYDKVELVLRFVAMLWEEISNDGDEVTEGSEGGELTAAQADKESLLVRLFNDPHVRELYTSLGKPVVKVVPKLFYLYKSYVHTIRESTSMYDIDDNEINGTDTTSEDEGNDDTLIDKSLLEVAEQVKAHLRDSFVPFNPGMARGGVVGGGMAGGGMAGGGMGGGMGRGGGMGMGRPMKSSSGQCAAKTYTCTSKSDPSTKLDDGQCKAIRTNDPETAAAEYTIESACQVDPHTPAELDKPNDCHKVEISQGQLYAGLAGQLGKIGMGLMAAMQFSKAQKVMSGVTYLCKEKLKGEMQLGGMVNRDFGLVLEVCNLPETAPWSIADADKWGKNGTTNNDTASNNDTLSNNGTLGNNATLEDGDDSDDEITAAVPKPPMTAKLTVLEGTTALRVFEFGEEGVNTLVRRSSYGGPLPDMIDKLPMSPTSLRNVLNQKLNVTFGRDEDGDFYFDIHALHMDGVVLAIPAMRSIVEDVLGLDSSKFKVNMKLAPKGKTELLGATLPGIYKALALDDKFSKMTQYLATMVAETVEKHGGMNIITGILDKVEAVRAQAEDAVTDNAEQFSTAYEDPARALSSAISETLGTPVTAIIAGLQERIEALRVAILLHNRTHNASTPNSSNSFVGEPDLGAATGEEEQDDGIVDSTSTVLLESASSTEPSSDETGSDETSPEEVEEPPTAGAEERMELMRFVGESRANLTAHLDTLGGAVLEAVENATEPKGSENLMLYIGYAQKGLKLLRYAATKLPGGASFGPVPPTATAGGAAVLLIDMLGILVRMMAKKISSVGKDVRVELRGVGDLLGTVNDAFSAAAQAAEAYDESDPAGPDGEDVSAALAALASAVEATQSKAKNSAQTAEDFVGLVSTPLLEGLGNIGGFLDGMRVQISNFTNVTDLTNAAVAFVQDAVVKKVEATMRSSFLMKPSFLGVAAGIFAPAGLSVCDMGAASGMMAMGPGMGHARAGGGMMLEMHGQALHHLLRKPESVQELLHGWPEHAAFDEGTKAVHSYRTLPPSAWEAHRKSAAGTAAAEAMNADQLPVHLERALLEVQGPSRGSAGNQGAKGKKKTYCPKTKTPKASVDGTAYENFERNFVNTRPKDKLIIAGHASVSAKKTLAKQIWPLLHNCLNQEVPYRQEGLKRYVKCQPVVDFMLKKITVPTALKSVLLPLGMVTDLGMPLAANLEKSTMFSSGSVQPMSSLWPAKAMTFKWGLEQKQRKTQKGCHDKFGYPKGNVPIFFETLARAWLTKLDSSACGQTPGKTLDVQLVIPSSFAGVDDKYVKSLLSWKSKKAKSCRPLHLTIRIQEGVEGKKPGSSAKEPIDCHKLMQVKEMKLFAKRFDAYRCLEGCGATSFAHAAERPTNQAANNGKTSKQDDPDCRVMDVVVYNKRGSTKSPFRGCEGVSSCKGVGGAAAFLETETETHASMSSAATNLKTEQKRDLCCTVDKCDFMHVTKTQLKAGKLPNTADGSVRCIPTMPGDETIHQLVVGRSSKASASKDGTFVNVAKYGFKDGTPRFRPMSAVTHDGVAPCSEFTVGDFSLQDPARGAIEAKKDQLNNPIFSIALVRKWCSTVGHGICPPDLPSRSVYYYLDMAAGVQLRLVDAAHKFRKKNEKKKRWWKKYSCGGCSNPVGDTSFTGVATINPGTKQPGSVFGKLCNKMKGKIRGLNDLARVTFSVKGKRKAKKIARLLAPTSGPKKATGALPGFRLALVKSRYDKPPVLLWNDLGYLDINIRFADQVTGLRAEVQIQDCYMSEAKATSGHALYDAFIEKGTADPQTWQNRFIEWSKTSSHEMSSTQRDNAKVDDPRKSWTLKMVQGFRKGLGDGLNTRFKTSPTTMNRAYCNRLFAKRNRLWTHWKGFVHPDTVDEEAYRGEPPNQMSVEQVKTMFAECTTDEHEEASDENAKRCRQKLEDNQVTQNYCQTKNWADGASFINGVEGSKRGSTALTDGPAIIGKMNEITAHCSDFWCQQGVGAGPTGTTGAGVGAFDGTKRFNRLAVGAWSIKENLKWTLCAAKGWLPGQGGAQIAFPVPPKDIPVVEQDPRHVATTVHEICYLDAICANRNQLWTLENPVPVGSAVKELSMFECGAVDLSRARPTSDVAVDTAYETHLELKTTLQTLFNVRAESRVLYKEADAKSGKGEGGACKVEQRHKPKFSLLEVDPVAAHFSDSDAHLPYYNDHDDSNYDF